jgi:hypothetical protein
MCGTNLIQCGNEKEEKKRGEKLPTVTYYKKSIEKNITIGISW